MSEEEFPEDPEGDWPENPEDVESEEEEWN
jgi:hypothetical protein